MPVGGEIFTLDQLAAATGTNLTPGGGPDSLFSSAGGAGATVIDFEDFSITSFDGPVANAAGYGYNATVTITCNFSTIGRRFLSRIANRPANFVWSPGTNLSTGTNSGYIHTFINAYNPGSTSCSSSTTSFVTVRFYDQNFNNHASSYNTNRSTTPFVLYSPPKPQVSAQNGSKPSTCVSGGICAGNNVSCYGATIVLNGLAGNYAGVAGSSLNYYVNSQFVGFNSGNSSQRQTAAQYCTSTVYTAFVINDFNCQSDIIAFTTVSYL